MRATRKRTRKDKPSGKLRIGDDWNAINIIALSQSNPLKAVAEFVENSIDANARLVTITRRREKGETYLRIRDDGDGIPPDEEGKPNFRYVATHICDSIKRQLKADGARGIQGEFGIGLLSFWTVGENLTMTTAGTDGRKFRALTIARKELISPFARSPAARGQLLTARCAIPRAKPCAGFPQAALLRR